jgi:hypothetical protein
VICVKFHVKPEKLDNFIEETSRHCDQTLLEHYRPFFTDPNNNPIPSTLRMRLIQSCAEQNFIQLFIYTENEESLQNLRSTPLYKIWIDEITPMLLKPRTSHKYVTVYSPLMKGEKPEIEMREENDEIV